jgi:hypothetical protein
MHYGNTMAKDRSLPPNDPLAPPSDSIVAIIQKMGLGKREK